MATPAARERHATFIVKRLAISFAGLAVAPFFVAFRGAPTAAEILVFACCFAPLAAAVLAARTGRIATAHGIAFSGLVVLSLCLSLGLGCGIACTAAWLIAAHLEAISAGDRRLTTVATVVTGCALAVVVGLSFVAVPSPAASPSVTSVLAGLALVYALVAAVGTRQEPNTRPRADTESELWRTIAGISDDLVMRFDASGSALAVVAGAEAALGDVTSSFSLNIFDHVHIMDRPAFLKQISDGAHGTPAAPAQVRLRTSAGIYKWFEMRARRLGLRLPVEVIVVMRDIDAVRERDAEVATSQAAVEEAVQAKDHFLANMGHELRTPLNAIIGFSEMLASRTLRPADPDKQREYARIIHQSGQHLLSVVNAILDMSKIRSGTFSLAMETFEIVPLVDLCCEMIALKVDAGGVRLVRDVAEDVSKVVGDKRAYKQILINLLSNAVKFTPPDGEVTIGIAIEADDLVMRVADTGVGIAAQDVARLGDPFFQARSNISRPVEGTGLGLSVVRGLVGLLGGSISIDSLIGQGTRVMIRVPMHLSAPRSRGPATIQAISPYRASDFTFARHDQRIKDIA